MKLPDGSPLMHGRRPYDPAKAREYYLRTRKLKGRRKRGTRRQQKLLPTTIATSKELRKSNRKKLKEIRRKLDLLARTGKGKSDVAVRTQSERKEAARNTRVLQKQLADLNESLKRKIADRAPRSEVGAIEKEIEETQKKLKTATKSG